MGWMGAQSHFSPIGGEHWQTSSPIQAVVIGEGGMGCRSELDVVANGIRIGGQRDIVRYRPIVLIGGLVLIQIADVE